MLEWLKNFFGGLFGGKSATQLGNRNQAGTTTGENSHIVSRKTSLRHSIICSISS